MGKVKLCDVDDGTKNVYVPFKKYLGREVKKACQLAHAFEAKLIRGFSFYPPKGADPWEHVPQAVDHLGQLAEACHRADLTYGLEIEANLVGCTGQILAEIHRQVNHPGMVLIFDAANVLVQGFSAAELYEQYLAMKPGLGWMHIKDYRCPATVRSRRAARSMRTPWPISCRPTSATVPTRPFCATSAASCRRWSGSSAAAASPACSSIWSRT